MSRAAFEQRLEHRREIARRRIYDPENLGGRRLLFERLVALGGALLELSPEFCVGALKICHRVVDRRGHALIPSGRGSGTIGL